MASLVLPCQVQESPALGVRRQAALRSHLLRNLGCRALTLFSEMTAEAKDLTFLQHRKISFCFLN